MRHAGTVLHEALNNTWHTEIDLRLTQNLVTRAQCSMDGQRALVSSLHLDPHLQEIPTTSAPKG